MSLEQWERLRDVVCEALERSSEERAAFVAEIGARDPELRAEVERLLDQQPEIGFLGGPEPGSFSQAAPVRDYAFAPGDVVGERYEIVAFLGDGGMGEVYRARDVLLNGKQVALKTIRADIARDERLHSRLKYEVLLTRDIPHENVCPVYDFAEATGRNGPVRFLTMKLLEGETLAQRLERSGPMTPVEALPLARQMAEGLSAAHRANVIHRDFKPGNVMLVDSPEGPRAVITDFGLARSISPDGAGPSQPGVVAGTLGYMAPEQLAGQRVGPPADIYAFGVVLHRMITGELPLGGKAAAAAPKTWGRVIERCLAADPGWRYQSALTAARELDNNSGPRRLIWPSVAWIAAVVLAASLLVGLRSLRQRIASPIPAVKHVAVLAVEDSGDTVSHEIGLGLQETLTGELERLEQFEKDYWVVPAKELRAGRVHTPSEAARAFGANLTVQGVLTRAGNGFRIELKLLDASGNLLDITRRMCPSDQLSRLSEYAVSDAARLLRVRLRDEAQRLPVLAGTQNPDAHRLFEAAEAQMDMPGIENVNKAVEQLLRAVSLDREYAQAYAALAEAWVTVYHDGRQPSALDLARDNSRKALELNPGLPLSHYGAALVAEVAGDLPAAEQEAGRTLQLDGNDMRASALLARIYSREGKSAEAEQAYRRTLKIRPNYWQAYSLLGEFYYRSARYAEAQRMFRTALLISPRNVRTYYNLAGVLIVTGAYDEAIDLLKKSIAVQENANAYSNLGSIYFLQKRYLQAAEAMQRAVELNPTNDTMWRNFGDACAKSPGREADMRRAYEKAFELARRQLMVDERNAGVLTNLALYSAKMGDRNGAARWLALAIRAKTTDLGVRFKQAQALELTGKRAAALAILDDLLRRGYSKQQILEASELESLRNDTRFRALFARDVVH